MTSNNITRVIAQAILLDWEDYDPILPELEFNLDYYAMHVNQNPDLAPVRLPPSYVEATATMPSEVDSRASTPLLDEEDEQLTDGQEELQLDDLRCYESLETDNDEPELSAPVRT